MLQKRNRQGDKKSMSVRYNYKIFDFSFSLDSDSSKAVRLFDLVYKNFRQKNGSSSSVSFGIVSNKERDKPPHLKIEEKKYPFHSFSDIESQCFKLVTDEIYKKVNSHFLIHGGGVVFQNKGVMVCGDSGTGKTSLILKLLSSGFKFLSDEVMPLDKKTGKMVPFPRSVGLRPEAQSLLGKGFSLFKELEFVNIPGHKYFGNPSLLKSERACKPVFPDYFIYLTSPDEGTNGEIDIDVISEGKREDFLHSLEEIGGLRIIDSTRKGNYVYSGVRIQRNATVIKNYLETCGRFKSVIVHTEKKKERGLKFSQKPQIRPLSSQDIGLFLLRQSKENIVEYNRYEYKSIGAYWLNLYKILNIEKMKGFEVRVGYMENMIGLIQNLMR